MRKHIFIFLGLVISCTLFSTPALGKKISERRLRQLIEELAVSLPENRVFYRWQSEESHDTLLKEGEFSKERLDYFMKKKRGIAAGPGLYIAEDLHSSSDFGTHIIQVEIDKGTKYIDLTDPETMEQITDSMRIDENIGEILYNLQKRSSNIVIKYSDQHWVLKANEGIKFQPFSAKGLPLSSLNGPGIQRLQFQKIVAGEILEHAKKDPLSVMKISAARDVLNNVFGEKYVADNFVSRLPIESVESIDDIIDLFPYAPYLNTDLKDKLVKKAQSLPVLSKKQGDALIRALSNGKIINAKLRTEIVQKTPINSLGDASALLKTLNDLGVPLEEKMIVANKAKGLPVGKMDEAINFLGQASFLNLEDREKIVFNIGRHYTSTYIGTTPLYDTMNLYALKHHISPEAMRKFLKEFIIPLAKTDSQKLDLLRVKEYLDPEDHKRVLKGLIRFIDSASMGNRILTLAGLGIGDLDPLDRKAIAKQTLKVTPRMKRRKTLESLSHFFAQSELDQFLIELKEEKKAQKSSKGKLNKVTQRLNCLKRQLSSVLSRH